MRVPSCDQSSSETAFQVRLKRSAHRGYRPPGVDGRLDTRLQSVTSEPSGEKPNVRVAGIPQLPAVAVGEVVDFVGPDLAHPGVPVPSAVGEEGDELSVTRNGGVLLGSLEIRQPRDRRAQRGFLQKYSDRCSCHMTVAAMATASTPALRPQPTRRFVSDDRPSSVTQSERAGSSAFLDLESCVADISQTPLRVLLETALDQSPDTRRRVRRRTLQSGSCSRIAATVSEVGLASKRRAAGQHLIQHAAERPDVGSLVDRLSSRLFRAHVGGCARNHALS